MACPICRKSIVDPALLEMEGDRQLAEMPMPDDYADTFMTVACNDCQWKSRVKFHILGGKCCKCRSYNTSRVEAEADVEPEVEESEQNDENLSEGENVSEIEEIE